MRVAIFSAPPAKTDCASSRVRLGVGFPTVYKEHDCVRERASSFFSSSGRGGAEEEEGYVDDGGSAAQLCHDTV